MKKLIACSMIGLAVASFALPMNVSAKSVTTKVVNVGNASCAPYVITNKEYIQDCFQTLLSSQDCLSWKTIILKGNCITIPDTTPEVTPDTTPEVTPDTTPEVTPDTTPEVTPDTTPEVTPDTTPEVTPDTTPEVTPDTTPEVTPDTTPETTPDTTPDQSELSYAEQVVALVNVERAAEGLAPLTIDTSITSAAMVRASEIQTYFSHTRPNGTSCSTVLKEMGVSYRSYGENIAYGQKTPESVVEGWMNSAGHRRNIMNANFTRIGVGYMQNNGINYWVQLFAN